MKELFKCYARKSPLLTKWVNFFKSGSIKPQHFIKNIIGKENIIKINDSSRLINCKFDICGIGNQIILHKQTTFNNVTFFVKGNNNSIIISNAVKFKKAGNLWIENENCIISIGEATTFENVHLAATESNSTIHIGDDCMFAYDIDIRTGDSHSIINNDTKQRINHAKNVVIGNHVWVASHVSILKGVTIPNNSIVATRSVVTKTFDEDNILLGGLPAKILKRQVDWTRSRIN